MSFYLPVRSVGGTMGIGICSRCQKKMYLGDMVQDPNNKLWVCKDDQDIYDPWRGPARRTEDISVPHPRPDVDISTDDGSHTLVPTT